MALRGQSYKQIRAVFMQTSYGKVTLELAVGQQRVLVKDSAGIKLTLNREEVKTRQHPLLDTCRDSDKERFNAFCTELSELNA